MLGTQIPVLGIDDPLNPQHVGSWCVAFIREHARTLTLSERAKNTERVIRGLKASIHNPRVSPEAKAHAEERLREMGQVFEPRQTTKSTVGAGRRRSGRKARRTSAGSKSTQIADRQREEAREVASEPRELGTEQRQASEPHTPEPTQPLNKHEARVLGGYKATLSKKGISEEAKRHARQVLEEHDAI
ncbi:hypothetical protein APHAL10511_007229 [Amanita phalloides]|nr:hypothetical protein APHAL10511_007229 [Amanita phalloides]